MSFPTVQSPSVSPPSHGKSLALFCTVIDNFGDIGICWRLARQLAHEHSVAVTLWVDDLNSFRRICPEVDIHAALQTVQDVTVRHWRDQDGTFIAAEIPDIVIEFFACQLPPGYIQAMSECLPRPVWLNLEGLSAETWVEGCHTLPSPHPQLPLTKYFFFPGFNPRTGGLQAEASLEQQRREFHAHPATATDFLDSLGVTAAEMASLKVSLFCYPQAPIAQLFSAWQGGDQALTCLVPEGIGGAAVTDFLGQTSRAGAHFRRGALTVRVLPFMPQPDYDRLLWACDVNFVRGEDSFVRAQWATKPFIWHIYPQDDDLHHIKLQAFLDIYGAATASLKAMAWKWNGMDTDDEAVGMASLWTSLAADLSDIVWLSRDWQRQLSANGDLVSNMLKFVETFPPRY